MPPFDVVLICVIAGFALFGLWFGLVHTLGSLVGTVVGVILATRWYMPFAEWLSNFTGWQGNFPKVLVFMTMFLVINRLIGLIFYVVDKFLAIFTALPFINGLDRILGAVLGFLEGLVVLGMMFYFINKFPLNKAFMEAVAASRIAPFCIRASSIFSPLIPEALQVLTNH